MLTDEHHAVNGLIASGTPFEYIEDYINSLTLPSEQLGALWLLAWAEATDAATRQRVVAETLALVHTQDEGSLMQASHAG